MKMGAARIHRNTHHPHEPDDAGPLREELWETLGHKTLLVETAWPKADPALLVANSVTIGVQVNGKLRGQITVPANSNED